MSNKILSLRFTDLDSFQKALQPGAGSEHLQLAISGFGGRCFTLMTSADKRPAKFSYRQLVSHCQKLADRGEPLEKIESTLIELGKLDLRGEKYYQIHASTCQKRLRRIAQFFAAFLVRANALLTAIEKKHLRKPLNKRSILMKAGVAAIAKYTPNLKSCITLDLQARRLLMGTPSAAKIKQSDALKKNLAKKTVWLNDAASLILDQLKILSDNKDRDLIFETRRSRNLMLLLLIASIHEARDHATPASLGLKDYMIALAARDGNMRHYALCPPLL